MCEPWISQCAFAPQHTLAVSASACVAGKMRRTRP